MKDLLRFTIGLAFGTMLMKRNQTIDDLREELERERYRNRTREQNG